MNRRQFLAAGLGVAGAAVTGLGLTTQVWPLILREDIIPGVAPDQVLQPHAWTASDDFVRFAVIGDSGSGGRNAMAVADRMARTYQRDPYGLVVLLGDIVYYGKLEDRFENAFQRPFRPLIDAGVEFELAIGNHDEGLYHSDEGLEEIEAELATLGTPGPYYKSTHGPVDLFVLDSSSPGLIGPGSDDQIEWLDDMLASSTNVWRVVAMHHPLYSSGLHGSNREAQERLQPLFTRHRVDLVLSGHDHDYERTIPIDGVTYVTSGGGCKPTSVGHSWFTVVSESVLQFMVIDADTDRLSARCIQANGRTADRFELFARDRRRTGAGR